MCSFQIPLKNSSRIALCFTIVFILSFSFNPPNGKTGAPNENYCIDCHIPGPIPISGKIDIVGFSDSVKTGSLNSLDIRIKALSGHPFRAGFQMVILDSLHQNIGQFMNPGDSSTIQSDELTGRSYFEHDIKARLFRPDSSVHYTVDWQAPLDRAGEEVYLYAVSMVVNGNGANSGDKMVTFRDTFRITGNTTAVVALESEEDVYKIYPNPVSNILFLDRQSGLSRPEKIFLLDHTGKTITWDSPVMSDGHMFLDLATLKPGLYYLSILTKNKLYSYSFVKI